MTEQVTRVRVVNRNTFTIRDRCDGMPWKFPPHEPVVIPGEVAAHIFGFPGDVNDMHSHMCKRFGWNQPEHIDPKKMDAQELLPWQRLCRNVTLEVEHYEMIRKVALEEQITESAQTTQTEQPIVKRRPGRPRRNPLPEVEGTTAAELQQQESQQREGEEDFIQLPEDEVARARLRRMVKRRAAKGGVKRAGRGRPAKRAISPRAPLSSPISTPSPVSSEAPAAPASHQSVSHDPVDAG